MNRLVSPSATRPIVDATGGMSQEMRSWTQSITNFSVVIGTGSPEGVVEASQGTLYMDDAGTTGAILYIKRDADLSGDKTKTWILV